MATKAQKRERGRLKNAQEAAERVAVDQANLQAAKVRRKISEDVRQILKLEKNHPKEADHALWWLKNEAANYGFLIRRFELQGNSTAQERKVREWAKFRESVGESPHKVAVNEAFWNARRVDE